MSGQAPSAPLAADPFFYPALGRATLVCLLICSCALMFMGATAQINYFNPGKFGWMSVIPAIPLHEGNSFMAAGGAIFGMVIRVRWLSLFFIAWLFSIAFMSTGMLLGFQVDSHTGLLEHYANGPFQLDTVPTSVAGIINCVLVSISLWRRLYGKSLLSSEAFATGISVLFVGATPFIQSWVTGQVFEVTNRGDESLQYSMLGYSILAAGFLAIGIPEVLRHKSPLERRVIALVTGVTLLTLMALYAMSGATTAKLHTKTSARAVDSTAAYVSVYLTNIKSNLEQYRQLRQAGSDPESLIAISSSLVGELRRFTTFEALASTTCPSAGFRATTSAELKYRLVNCFSVDGTLEGVAVTIDVQGMATWLLLTSGASAADIQLGIVRSDTPPMIGRGRTDLPDTDFVLDVGVANQSNLGPDMLTADFLSLFLALIVMNMVITVTDLTLSLRASKAWSTTLQNATPTGLMVVDEDGTILSANAAACGHFNTTNATGRSVYSIMPDFDLYALLEARGPRRVRIILTDHDFLDLDVNAKQISSAPLPRYLISSIDITRVNDLITSIEKERGILNTILQVTSEGIIGMDRSGRVVFSNRAASRLLGYDDEGMLGLRVRDILTASNPSERTAQYREQVLSGGTVSVDIDYFRRLDGTLLPVSFTVAPAGDNHELPLGAVLVFSDATEQLEIEHQRADHIRQLTHVNDDLTHFNYIIAHDLMEPVRGINLYAELVERAIEAGERHKADAHFKIVRSLASRMIDTMKDLRKFMEEAGRDVTQSMTTLQGVIANVQMDVLSSIQASGACVDLVNDTPLYGVLGFFRPKTTIIAESPAIRGLQEGIAFSEVHIYTNFG